MIQPSSILRHPQLELAGVPAPPAGGSSVVAVPPRHGELTQTVSGQYLYSPNKSFWTLRQDRFVLELTSAVHELPEVKVVRLFASTPTSIVAEQGFENPSNLGPWVLAGGPGIHSSASLDGALGLHTVSDPYYFTDQAVYNLAPGLAEVAAEVAAEGAGGAVPGGGARGHFLDVDSSCVSGCAYDSVTTAVGLQDRFGPENLIVWAELKKTASSLAVRLATSDSEPDRPWAAITPEPHRIELLAWPPASGGSGTAMLWVDGQRVDELSSPLLTAPDVLTGGAVFGSRDATGISTAIHRWDEVAALAVEVYSAPPAVVCSDGFDGTALDPSWSSYNVLGLGKVANALLGARSLEIKPNSPGSPAGGLLIANGLQPENIRRLGLRFELSAAGLEMPAGSTLLLLDSANQLGSRSFRVLIDSLAGGVLQMRALARHDDPATPAATVSFPLTLAPHTLEIDWWRSETDVAGTGHFRLWLDGEEKADLTGLLNLASVPLDLRLGAVTVAGAPGGKMVLDALDLWYE